MLATTDRRARQAIVMVAAVSIVAAWARAVPHEVAGGFDHDVFRDVIGRMRAGDGYYEAFREGFADVGAVLSQGRSFRLPTTFWLWSAVGEDLLYPMFLVGVVLASTGLGTMLSQRPEIALTLLWYLLNAGENFDLSAGSIPLELWLLQEFWAVPLVLGSLVAWQRERWALAAACATGAFFVRELAVLVVIGGLLAAHVSGRGPRRPWLVALGACAAGLVVHWSVAAQQFTEGPGREAPLIGSGRGVATLLEMVSWPLPGPSVLGLVPLVLALDQLRRRDLLLFLGPLFALAITGLFVARDYWGVLIVPFSLFFAAEWVLDRVAELRSRTPQVELSSPAPAP